MTIVFDKTEPRLRVEAVPEGTNKVSIETAPYKFEGIPVDGVIEVGNFRLALQATVKAIKREEVVEQVPILDPGGEQLIIDGEPQFLEETHIEETILESITVELNVL